MSKNLIISFVVTAALVSSLAGCEQISDLFPQKASEKKINGNATQPTENRQPTSLANNPNVLASVGTWSITIEEFNERLKKLKDVLPEFDPNDLDSKKLIVEELVRQQLLVAEAEQTGLANKKEIVDTVEDFRRTLLVQDLATSLTKDIQATEADAQQYYNENKKEFIVQPEWKIRQIIVPTESEAKEILVQLLQGGDFTQIAKDKSKAANANKGGDLGFISKMPFDQMQAALSSLEVGKISTVFKGPDGYYIIKLDDKRGGQPKPFQAIKSELIKGLTLKKQQDVILEHLNGLAAKTDIKVNEELLK